MSWSELCSQFLLGNLTSEKIQSMSRTWAVISIGFLPQESAIKNKWASSSNPENIFDILLPFRGIRAQWLRQVPEPRFISGHDFGLELYYDNIQQALDIALALLRDNGHSIRIALGYDTGLLVDSTTYKSVDSYRAQHLLAFTNPHEVTLTNQFKTNCVIPDGVGTFPASNPLRNRLGFDFWIAKDYRSL